MLYLKATAASMGLLKRMTLWAEKKYAGSITKRTLAPGAAPIKPTGEAEPEQLAAMNDAWTALLRTHVRPATVDGLNFAAMDYSALAADERFEALLESFAALDGAAVARWPKAAVCALYINAYNALCANHICARLRSGAPKPASITDLKEGGKDVWNAPAGSVAGRELSLNEIEHGILRTDFKEPRVHACVNCASRSCPDLLDEAYRGDDRLDAQLTAQLTKWLKEPAKGLYVDAGEVTLSRIFLWYSSDFDNKPAAFAAPFAPTHRAALEKSRHPGFFEYDWQLNTAA